MSLRPEDRELIARLRRDGRINRETKFWSVRYFEQGGRQRSDGTWERGNFTIAVMEYGDTGRIMGTSIGVAKRNFNDDDQNDRRGRDIALIRALRGDARPLI